MSVRRETRAAGRTRSARSSSASFPVLSTFTRAPKILILSVSIAGQMHCVGTNSVKVAWELTGIGNEDLGVFESFWTIDADRLVQNEAFHVLMSCMAIAAGGRNLTFIEIRICQLFADLLDDLNMVQICRALNPPQI